MGSILSWTAVWVAAGFMAELMVLCLVYKIGHAAGEVDCTDEIHNLNTLLKRQKRELDFVNSENDHFRKLLYKKVDGAHLPGNNEREERILTALLDSVRVRSNPPTVPLPKLAPGAAVPNDHVRGINSQGNMILAYCQDPNCAFCSKRHTEEIGKQQSGIIPGLILPDKNQRE